MFETSDLGRNSLELLLAGPITDTVGYTLNVNVDEYDAPDDWVSTEGFGLHGSTTEYLDGKLKFTPSDNFDAEITFSHLVTDDENPLEINISPEAYAACTNFPSPNLVGVNWIKGTFDCDVPLPVGGNPTNIDTAAAYAGTPDELLARAFSVSDPGVYTERNRIQGEFNFALANDTTIQVLGFVLEEQKEWWNDTDRSDVPVNISMGMLAMGMQPISHMASPADTDEQMVEVRWLSPDTERLRWMVGASNYEYDVLNIVWSQYDAIVNGYADELAEQFGFTVVPNVIFSEDSKNVGLFGSINYDISDRTTFSFEGRWQNEKLTHINPVTSESFTNDTNSFLPRIAITHTLPSNVTLYAQASKGNNPAGVIPAARSPRIVETHAQATALELVNWSLDSVLFYEEEEITNFEFGVKATLAENRVTLASTIYTMDWGELQPAVHAELEHQHAVGAVRESRDVAGVDSRLRWRRLHAAHPVERRRLQCRRLGKRSALACRRQLDAGRYVDLAGHAIRGVLFTVGSPRYRAHTHESGHRRFGSPVQLRQRRRQFAATPARPDVYAQRDLPGGARQHRLAVERES